MIATHAARAAANFQFSISNFQFLLTPMAAALHFSAIDAMSRVQRPE
jgi:hypothetical protein